MDGTTINRDILGLKYGTYNSLGAYFACCSHLNAGFRGQTRKLEIVHGIYSSTLSSFRMRGTGNIQSSRTENRTSRPQHNMLCDICWKVKYHISMSIQLILLRTTLTTGAIS